MIVVRRAVRGLADAGGAFQGPTVVGPLLSATAIVLRTLSRVLDVVATTPAHHFG